MKDIDRAMKYFIIFALGSAVVLPFTGEIYANVSKHIAIAILIAWGVIAGLKFSSLELKSAMLGLTSYVFSSMVLSLVGYVIIHPAVQNWLDEHSVYFPLALNEWVAYWAAAFGLLLAAFPVYFARFGMRKAADKFKANSESAASAIDNAFAEDEQ